MGELIEMIFKERTKCLHCDMRELRATLFEEEALGQSGCRKM